MISQRLTVYILVPVLVALLTACKDPAKETLYDAGFTIFKTQDKSRIYKPDTDSTNYLYHRPLDIDMWYPAKALAADSTMTFRDLLGLLAERANYYTASTVGNGLTKQMTQYLCEGFKCSDTTRALKFRSRSYSNAAGSR